LFLLVAGYDEHYAVPLSKVIIFAAAFMDFWLYRPLRHPVQKWRPLIYYDIAVLLEPLILGGTSIGVLLNLILPNFVIGILLILLLTFTCYRMFKKGKDLRMKETHIGTTEDMSQMELRDVMLHSPVSDVEPTSLESHDNTIEGFPWKKNLWLVVAWILILASSLGKNFALCNSGLYWFLTIILLPLLFAITYFYGKQLVKEHRDRSLSSYAPGDIFWNKKNVLIYPLIASSAGVAASLLGVGGGMITGPIMLELGVLPEVSRVTSAYMILFTSSCTTVQYLILGRVRTDEAIWYMFWGLVGAVLGHFGVEWLLKKFKGTYILVYVLAWAVLISTLAMGAENIFTLVTSGVTGFSSICV